MQKLPKCKDTLLTRDQFREAVFARDNNKCVICGELAQDAHHILERRLFQNGGYFLSNGASLCGKHHIEAEQTILSVETIRENIGIVAPAIPEHFYPDEQYDKWGNIMLGNGNRTKGELFWDESVQKILKDGDVLHLFMDHVKYPRTLHLPWSPGKTDDDRVHQDLSGFEGQDVIVTLKKDGENTNLYTNYFHARSLDGKSHPSQSWVRQFHSQMGFNIPKGWRVCAENLYAKHSLGYDDLESYLLAFSIWNSKNECLAWDEFVDYCNLLDISHVPVIYRGKWNEEKIRDLWNDKTFQEKEEGYVVRVARAFQFGEFKRVVGKYVRVGHVQTTHHWKSQAIVPNKLKQQ